MQHDEFDKVFEETIEKSRSVLVSKSKEYSTEDKLHNFKVSAEMRGVSNRDALGGMMVKHTTSIYDLLRADDCADLVVWDEKIIDHINYLVLLRALVIEEIKSKAKETILDSVFKEPLSSRKDPIFKIKDKYDGPEMPNILEQLKPKDEIHITYKCKVCNSEVVNVTKSGTIYDRISCVNCWMLGKSNYMHPQIENPRSGVENMNRDV